MFDPDPIAMLLGTVLFLVALVVTMAVTAVRRRTARQLATERSRDDTVRTRKFAG
jgi:uncharacterized membrane protein